MQSLGGATSHQTDDIREVANLIEARAISTVFQPVVRLDTREIVGYEALSRGPAGTRWERPAVLFATAHAAGLLAELDWICRAHAYRAAITAGMDSSTTLFVNTEPLALGSHCPPDLRKWHEVARQRLRVVTEMTERAVAAHPSALLTAAAAARAAGWGVAFDDVGADPASLAMLPFVHPDVVKLDMHLVHDPNRPEVAQVVNAVIAYAEQSGATILAEGIETEEHVAVARSLGASHGQGWLYGAGEPLTSTPTAPRKPVAFVRAPQTAAPSSPTRARTPFQIVSERRPTSMATKRILMTISQYLESKAADRAEPPVLLASLQDGKYLTPATSRRFSKLADSAAMVAVLASDLCDEPLAGVRGACLSPTDHLCGEWNVIVVGPHFAGALVARDLGDTGLDLTRRYEYALTYDRPLALAAARALMHRLVPTESM
jgi:EAL domain-containing protein (putative c-di-GMP-specific phosphodiesterase class I)